MTATVGAEPQGAWAAPPLPPLIPAQAVTSIIGGVGAALAANAVGAGQLPVAASASVGMLVAVTGAAGFGWHQLRRWRTAEASVPSLFPSQPATDPSQADS
jgi:hypothetical protein